MCGGFRSGACRREFAAESARMGAGFCGVVLLQISERRAGMRGWLFRACTACPVLGVAALCGMVGSRGKIAVRNGAGLPADGGSGRVAVEQSTDFGVGSAARVDGDFSRGWDGAATSQKRGAHRLSGILAGRNRLAEVLDHHATRINPAGSPDFTPDS